jgi:hypothetical protein
MKYRPLQNRALQVTMVRTDDQSSDTETEKNDTPSIDPQDINKMLKEGLEDIGKTVLIVAAGLTALATAREVIVNNTNPANRR